MPALFHYSCVPSVASEQARAHYSLPEGPKSHTTGRRNRCQKSRERGYYHLHRHLNESLFHDYSLFTIHHSLAKRSGVGLERLGDRPSSVLLCQTLGACPQVFRAFMASNPCPNRHHRYHRCYRPCSPRVLLQHRALRSYQSRHHCPRSTRSRCRRA